MKKKKRKMGVIFKFLKFLFQIFENSLSYQILSSLRDFFFLGCQLDHIIDSQNGDSSFSGES